MENKMRIQKYMSQSGLCSRRKAEEYIIEGLVFVNGEVATIGQVINIRKDKIKFGDKILKKQKELIYYKMNKPRGIVTTCANNGDKNILDIVNIKQRVFPIGRLDKDTTGLIILTNDGRLTNFLIHPKYEHEKEYIVETFGAISNESLLKMSKGVYILDSYKTKPCKIKRIASGKFSIILTEGKNRQIRRMVEAVNKKVKKLKRIRIENVVLGNLKYGEYKKLGFNEQEELFKRIGLKK